MISGCAEGTEKPGGAVAQGDVPAPSTSTGGGVGSMSMGSPADQAQSGTTDGVADATGDGSGAPVGAAGAGAGTDDGTDTAMTDQTVDTGMGMDMTTDMTTDPATTDTTGLSKPPANMLPQVEGSCPTLATGSVTVAGATARIWVGSTPGPAYFYFHGTGTTPGEVDQGLPGATAGVATNGGLVASWETSNGQGVNTGTIWYTGDLDGVDQIVACGIEQGIIDTSRIHVAGFSAGGLETGAAIFGRSGYVASGIVYSGGKPFGAGGLQDPAHVPAMLGAHGAQGSDALGLDFHDGTIAMENEIVNLGGFAIDCDDGGDHIVGWITRAGVGGQAMQFLADHPYNTKPSPYENGLPAGFPSYCEIVK
ncbi:MAG: hypothetical protein PVI30_11575 [Myxococcales bacterium]